MGSVLSRLLAQQETHRKDRRNKRKRQYFDTKKKYLQQPKRPTIGKPENFVHVGHVGFNTINQATLCKSNTISENNRSITISTPVNANDINAIFAQQIMQIANEFQTSICPK